MTNPDDEVAFTFEVTKGQAKKYEEWRAKRNPNAYAGAIGGRETWEFTGTSIGQVVKVRDCMGSKEDSVLDLSDYENW
jgi:hypothetical protein